jgi:hypothetical protein
MAKKRSAKDRERLRELIEEATVDCYDEDEQETGLLSMIEENLVCPFRAKVIGEEVEVVDLKPASEGRGVKAICKYKGKEYPIDVTSLEWGKERPEGAEWIEAYLAWRKGGV